MQQKKVLILEDDIRTLRFILSVFDQLGDERDMDFGVTILPDYQEVEALVNKNLQFRFDILLLDRSDHVNGSFHIVDLSHFDMNTVISISSVDQYNRQAKELGVRRVVQKNYADLPDFKIRLHAELSNILDGNNYTPRSVGEKEDEE